MYVYFGGCFFFLVDSWSKISLEITFQINAIDVSRDEFIIASYIIRCRKYRLHGIYHFMASLGIKSVLLYRSNCIGLIHYKRNFKNYCMLLPASMIRDKGYGIF